MKLKPTMKGIRQVETVQKPIQKTQKPNKPNKLPSDEYRPMLPPKRILVRECHNEKDPSKVTKQYLELSVKRFNDDEAKPNIWLSMYQESELYTGYLKNRVINFPLDAIYDILDELSELGEDCEKHNIED